MPDWPVFGTVAIALTVGFVWLARASARALRAALDASEDPAAPRHPAVAVLESPRLLAANVVASHGLLIALVSVTVWYARVPLPTLGIDGPSPGTVVVGVGLGVVLAIGNEASARLAERVGLDRDERLRARLAPDRPIGWLLLLIVVLPLVAAAEELLFRAVLVSGFAAGFGLNPWLLAAVSSVAFGLGHGLQGRAGIAVTAGLGAVLAGAFVVTGSLTVVVVAHYLVNGLEFVGNEWDRSAVDPL